MTTQTTSIPLTTEREGGASPAPKYLICARPSGAFACWGRTLAEADALTAAKTIADTIEEFERGDLEPVGDGWTRGARVTDRAEAERIAQARIDEERDGWIAWVGADDVAGVARAAVALLADGCGEGAGQLEQVHRLFDPEFVEPPYVDPFAQCSPMLTTPIPTRKITAADVPPLVIYARVKDIVRGVGRTADEADARGAVEIRASLARALAEDGEIEMGDGEMTADPERIEVQAREHIAEMLAWPMVRLEGPREGVENLLRAMPAAMACRESVGELFPVDGAAPPIPVAPVWRLHGRLSGDDFGRTPTEADERIASEARAYELGTFDAGVMEDPRTGEIVTDRTRAEEIANRTAEGALEGPRIVLESETLDGLLDAAKDLTGVDLRDVWRALLCAGGEAPRTRATPAEAPTPQRAAPCVSEARKGTPGTAPRASTWAEFEGLTDSEGRALLAHMVKRSDGTRLRPVWDALTSTTRPAPAPGLRRYTEADPPYVDDDPRIAELPTSQACHAAQEILRSTGALEDLVCVDCDLDAARSQIGRVRAAARALGAALDDLAIDIGGAIALREIRGELAAEVRA